MRRRPAAAASALRCRHGVAAWAVSPEVALQCATTRKRKTIGRLEEIRSGMSRGAAGAHRIGLDDDAQKDPTSGSITTHGTGDCIGGWEEHEAERTRRGRVRDGAVGGLGLGADFGGLGGPGRGGAGGAGSSVLGGSGRGGAEASRFIAWNGSAADACRVHDRLAQRGRGGAGRAASAAARSAVRRGGRPRTLRGETRRILTACETLPPPARSALRTFWGEGQPRSARWVRVNTSASSSAQRGDVLIATGGEVAFPGAPGEATPP